MLPLDREWHLLTFAGHGGAAHLDVFKSDEQARQYYARPPMRALDAGSGAVVWAAFRRLALETASEQDEDNRKGAWQWKHASLMASKSKSGRATCSPTLACTQDQIRPRG